MPSMSGKYRLMSALCGLRLNPGGTGGGGGAGDGDNGGGRMGSGDGGGGEGARMMASCLLGVVALSTVTAPPNHSWDMVALSVAARVYTIACHKSRRWDHLHDTQKQRRH